MKFYFFHSVAEMLWSESPGDLSAPNTICSVPSTSWLIRREPAQRLLSLPRYNLDVTKASAASAHSCFCREPGKVRRQKEHQVDRGESGACVNTVTAELRNRCAGCENPFSRVWGLQGFGWERNRRKISLGGVLAFYRFPGKTFWKSV